MKKQNGLQGCLQSSWRDSLQDLKRKSLVWQGSHHLNTACKIPSGYPQLDEKLQGGIPEQGVMLVQSLLGVGELRLLMPYLKTRADQAKKLLVFISPPMKINGEMLQHYGLALSDILIITPDTPQHALWSAEQCLKSGTCHTVLLWQHNLTPAQAKRLQLSAKKGQALQIILNDQITNHGALPVSLILDLKPLKTGLHVEIKKYQGHWAPPPFQLNMQTQWPDLTLSQPIHNVVAIHRAS